MRRLRLLRQWIQEAWDLEVSEQLRALRAGTMTVIGGGFAGLMASWSVSGKDLSVYLFGVPLVLFMAGFYLLSEVAIRRWEEEEASSINNPRFNRDGPS